MLSSFTSSVYDFAFLNQKTSGTALLGTSAGEIAVSSFVPGFCGQGLLAGVTEKTSSHKNVERQP